MAWHGLVLRRQNECSCRHHNLPLHATCDMRIWPCCARNEHISHNIVVRTFGVVPKMARIVVQKRWATSWLTLDGKVWLLSLRRRAAEDTSWVDLATGCWTHFWIVSQACNGVLSVPYFIPRKICLWPDLAGQEVVSYWFAVDGLSWCTHPTMLATKHWEERWSLDYYREPGTIECCCRWLPRRTKCEQLYLVLKFWPSDI